MFIKKSKYGLFVALFSAATLSAFDADNSGVSDVFELIHGRVLPADEDADFDGYTNFAESLFGSDPLDATSPGDLGFAVDDDTGSIRVPDQLGLRYRLQSSTNLGAGSWTPFGDFIVSDGTVSIAEFDLQGATAEFFRIELTDPLNSDEDGLNDWEEGQLGTDPSLADTDNDLLNDDIEAFIAGSSPFLVDTDGDGFIDRDEFESGSDPNSANSRPAEALEFSAYAIQVTNNAAPTEFLGESWSQPMAVQNLAAPTELLGEAWSTPISVRNDAAPTELTGEAWSNPILVRNDSLSIASLPQVWSSPILVLNNFTAVTP